MRWQSSLTLRSPIGSCSLKSHGIESWHHVMGLKKRDNVIPSYDLSWNYTLLRSTVPRIDLSFFLLRTKIFWRKNRKNSDRQLQYIILRRLYTKRGMWLIKIRFSTYRERLSVSWEPKLFHVTFVCKLRIHCPNQNLNLCINIEPVTVGADATG